MLNFVSVVWGSEFLLRMFTVIIQWSLHKGLCDIPAYIGWAVTFQHRMGCKEGDAIVRPNADFEVPDVLVFLPSFKMLFGFCR